MSLWVVHPKYLDKQGLVSVWREGLRAQKILSGETACSSNQMLVRQFAADPQPMKAIGAYLSFIAAEGARRGYKFGHEKIKCPNFDETAVPLEPKDLVFEMKDLRRRLKARDKDKWRETVKVEKIEPHPGLRGSVMPMSKWIQ